MVSYKAGLYECDECKLRYADKATAEKCQNWCSTRHSCNLEIIRHAVKNGRESSK